MAKRRRSAIEAPATPEGAVADSARIPSPPKRRRRRFTLPFRIFLVLLTLVLLAGVVGYILYTQWLSKPDNVRALALSKLEALFPDKTVKIGSASFSLFGGLDLYGVELIDKATGTSVARLDSMHMDFDYRKAVSGKVLIKNASASGLFLDLVHGADGSWNVSAPVSSKKGPSKPPLSLPFSFRLEAAFISVDDEKAGYSVSFPVDSALAMTGATTVSSWRVTSTFGGSLLGKWRLSATGDVDERRIDARFAVSAIDARGLDNRLPQAARKVYNEFAPSGPLDVSGRVGYAPADGWGWNVLASLKGMEVTYRRFPERLSGLSGTVSFDRDGYEFQNLTGTGAGGPVTISGRGGYGPMHDTRVIVTSRDSLIDDSLLSAIPDRAEAVIRAFHPSGRVDADTTVHRPAGRDSHTEVAVDLRLKDASATYDVFPLSMDHVSGRIVYTDGDVVVEDVTGSHGDAAVTVSGSVKRTGPDGSHAIDVLVGARGLRMDEALLAALPEDVTAVLKTFAVTGSTDVGAHVKRPPDGDVDVSVTADLIDAGVTYSEIPYALSSGAGRVIYQGGRVRLEGLRFRHGQATIAVSGEAGAPTGPTMVSIVATNVPIDRALKDALPREVTDTLERVGVSGSADARVGVARPEGGEARLTDVTVTLVNGQFMEPSLPIGMGAATGSFLYADDYLDIESLTAAIFPDNVSAARSDSEPRRRVRPRAETDHERPRAAGVRRRGLERALRRRAAGDRRRLRREPAGRGARGPRTPTACTATRTSRANWPTRAPRAARK